MERNEWYHQETQFGSLLRLRISRSKSSMMYNSESRFPCHDCLTHFLSVCFGRSHQGCSCCSHVCRRRSSHFHGAEFFQKLWIVWTESWMSLCRRKGRRRGQACGVSNEKGNPSHVFQSAPPRSTNRFDHSRGSQNDPRYVLARSLISCCIYIECYSSHSIFCLL